MSEKSFFGKIDQKQEPVETGQRVIKTPEDRFFSHITPPDTVASQAQSNINATRDIVPDKEAEHYQLSKVTGLPISTVRLAPEQVKAKSLYKISKDETIQEFQARSHTNAAISKDDTQNLEKAQASFSEKITRSFQRGTANVELGNLRAEQLFGDVSQDTEDRIQQLKRQIQDTLSEDFEPRGFVEKGLVGAAEQFPILATTSTKGLERGFLGASVGAAGAAIAGQLGPQVALPEEIVTIPAAAAAGFGVGFKAGSTEQIYKLEAGLAYDEFLDFRDENDQPLDPNITWVVSNTVGIINAGLELASLTKLLQTIPGGEKLLGRFTTDRINDLLRNPTIRQKLLNVGKKYVTAIGVESLTEAVQETVTILGGELAKEVDPGVFEGIEMSEVAKRAFAAGEAAIGPTVVFGAPGSVVGVYKSVKDVHDSNDFNDNIKKDRAAISETLTAQRSKDHAKEFIETVGADSDVYVSSEGMKVLFQSHTKETTDELLKNIGVDPDVAQDSITTGEDTVIRSKDILTLSEEEYSIIKDDLKPAPGAYTQRQINEGTATEDIENLTNHVKEDVEKTNKINAEITRIQGEGKKAGLIEEVSQNAPILMQGIANKLEDEGVDPVEFLKKITLKKKKFANIKALIDKGRQIFQADSKAPSREELQAKQDVLEQGIEDNLKKLKEVRVQKKNAAKSKPESKEGRTEKATKIRTLIQEEIDLINKRKGLLKEKEGFEVKAPPDVISKRGMLTIEQEAYTISLFEDADLSTILHEVGHIALNEYTNLENVGQASESLIKDMGVIREWVGAEKGKDFTTEQLETFARGFEAYLMEGKAPTSGMRAAFERFKRWLTETYKSVKGLDVSLNKNVRQVFDRMLSANIEVEATAVENGFIVKTVDEMNALGMVKADQIFAARLMDRVKKKAERRLTQARNKGYRQNLATWKEDAREELKRENKVYRIIELISDAVLFLKATKSKEKIQWNRNEFIERYGKDAIKDLPTSRILIKDGISLDEAAVQYGYDDANSMMDQFFATPKPSVAVNQRVAEKQAAHDAQWQAEDFMVDLKEYRDYLDIMSRYIGGRGIDEAAINQNIERNRGRWQKEATQEISQESPELTGTDREQAINDRTEQKIDSFRQTKARPSVISKETIKRIARETMAAKTVREARRVDKFLSAMKKASSDERRAILRQDWGEASRQNELNRFNYEMAGLSVKVREETDTILKRAKRIGKPKKTETVDLAHKEAILHLIDRFKLASLVPSDPLTLPDYGALFAGDKYGNDGFSDIDFLSSNVKDFRGLPAEQLRDLDNAIRYLEGQGRTDKKTYLSDGVTRLDDTGRATIAEMDIQNRQKVFDQMNPWRRASDPARKKFAEFTNISFLTTAYGGYKSLKGKISVVEKFISERLKDMTDAQTLKMKDVQEKIKPHVNQVLKGQRRIIKQNKGRKLFVADNNVPVPALLQRNGAQLNYWTPEQIFSMAFNRGNDSNTNALLAGFEGLTLGQVDTLLNRYLTIDDINAVQGIINEMEALFPEANEIHIRSKNYGMVKIEARPWIFKGKTFKGGYYPLSIDRRLASVNTDVFNSLKEAEEFFESEESKYTVPYAASNFSITRKDSHALPINLGLWPIQKHFDDVTRYITMSEGTRDIYRIVTYSERVNGGTISFKKSSVRILGEDMYNQVLPAIKHTINPRLSGVDIPGDRFIGWLRGVAVSRNIAAKLFTGLKQPFSLFGGVHDLGVKTGGGVKLGIDLFLKGTGHVLASPSVAWDTMLEKSPFMFARVTSWERDLLRPHFNKMTPNQREVVFGDRAFTWDDVIKATFITVSAPDVATVTPIWWGAYLGKLEIGATEKEAVRHADNIIRHSQPTAAPIDRSAWFRKNGFWGLFTLHQTYTTGTYGQRQRTWFRAWKNGEVSTAEYARFNTMDAIIPMTLMQIMVSWLKGGDLTDEDEWLEIAWKSLINAAFLGIPMAVSAIDALISGSRGGLLEIPGASQVDRWLQTGKLLAGGIDGMTNKEKERAYLGVFDMVSDISRVPMSRIYRQATKGRDVKEKLFGPRKKKK